MSGYDVANCLATIGPMKTVPLSEAKDKLSSLVEEAEATHEIVTITRHGRPAAVLMASEDLESLRETLHWLTERSDAVASTREAEEEYAAGETLDGAALRERLGLPAR